MEISLDIIKDGEKWTVYGNIGKVTKRRYGRFVTRKKAEKRRTALMEKHLAPQSIVTAKDRVNVEEALTKLKTTDNEYAKGKDILEAVKWFCAKYRDDPAILTFAEYSEKFLRLRNPETGREAVAPNTYKNDVFYLGKFIGQFGPVKPDSIEVNTETLKEWCRSFATEIHPYKVIYGFYSWLSRSHTRMERIPNPAFHSIQESPFGGYKRPKEYKAETMIATCDEVLAIFRKAHEHDVLPYFYMGFRLGIRPQELLTFLSLGDIWSYIHLTKKNPMVIIPNWIEKTRKRSREIPLRESDVEFLRYFKDNEVRMRPKNLLKKKRDHVFGEVLDEKHAKHKDIMRHTCISNLCQVEDKLHKITMACATSEQMIRDHYLRLVNEKDARRFFGIRPLDIINK